MLVWMFSFPGSSRLLSDRGLRFTSLGDIQESLNMAADTGRNAERSVGIDTQKIKTLSKAEQQQLDTLRKKIRFLDNHAMEDGKSALDAFFAALGMTGDTSVHIWYYGDSQIEGDRITQDLRQLMQGRFGGRGQGLVPFDDVASYRNLELRTGSGWNKQNVFIHRKARGFGFSGVKFFTGKQDSNFNPVAVLEGSKALQYDRAYLLFGKSNGGKVLVTTDNDKDKPVSIPETALTGRVMISSGTSRKIRVRSEAPGTDFYGYLLESQKGIQIDNCGIRGHSGDGLFNISDAMLKAQAVMLNTKLVVFHYGNNAIPYLKSPKHTASVGNEFYKLFVKFRKALPGVSILVISGGDMGRMQGGEAKPYPFARLLADEIGKAAQKAGCAFFDMYALMDKEGGILGWKRKGLANLDGHLSPAGQLYFAKSLYQELMKAYEVHNIIKPSAN